MVRKSIPRSVEAAVLLDCARRCALCYGWDHDLGRKRGQIAHVNRDAADSRPDNLVYLCLPHHDEYDSVSRQTKVITMAEVLEFKARLEKAIAGGEHRVPLMTVGASPKRHEHDVKIFRESNDLLTERALRDFLDELIGNNAYDGLGVRGVDKFLEHSALTEKRFIAPSLQAGRQDFVGALGDLRRFLHVHFFVYPTNQSGPKTRWCLYPEQNIDRGGDGSPKTMAWYEKHRIALEGLAAKVEGAYEAYRLVVKAELAE